MSIRAKQVLLAVLGLSGALVGFWAEFWPAAFYTTFPGLGHHWVVSSGPYDEHLVRDVGALYLALCAISVWGVLRPADETLRLAGVAWTVFSLPHLVFHLRHLDDLRGVDQVGETASLAATLLLAVLLAAAPSRSPSAG
jgi:hypothetical protein